MRVLTLLPLLIIKRKKKSFVRSFDQQSTYPLTHSFREQDSKHSPFMSPESQFTSLTNTYYYPRIKPASLSASLTNGPFL